MDMKRFFLYFIVIAALALAGCGGNGGGTPTTMEPDMCPSGQTGTPPNCMTPPPPTAAVDLSGLPMGFGLTADDAETYEIAAGASMDVGNVTFSCPAGGMSCSVEVAADGTAMSTGGAATASLSSAGQMAYDAQKEEERKAALAKGMGIATALQTPTAAAAGNGMPVWAATSRTTLADGTTANTSSTITRATTGAPKITLKVMDDGDDTDTDTNPDAFAAADDITMSMPPAITGWMGQTQSRTDDDTTDMVTVYTDIKAAEPKKLEVTSADASDLSLQNNTAVLDDRKASYSEDDTFTGTFRGHRGTFTCTAASCAVTFPASPPAGQNPNTAATIGGTWSFKSDAYIESLAVQDADHLYFGYWLQDRGDNKFAFNTFFGGATPFEVAASGNDLTGNTILTAVESKAVYTGSAAGKYVEKTLAIQGGEAMPVAIAGDYFTADARLTAYFGQSTGVAADDQNTIRGTISNFKNSNGDDVNFRINLKAIDFGVETDAGNGNRDTTDASKFMGGEVAGIHGTGQDISQSTSGSWKGQFFGPLAAGEATTSTSSDPPGAAPTLPTGVAGDFQAHFNDGHVVGAFGATR